MPGFDNLRRHRNRNVQDQRLGLVVGPVVDYPEQLNEIEEEYRRHGAPPVMFDDTGEEGGGWNADLFAKEMRLPAGELPTMEQAEAFQRAWLIAGKNPNEGNKQ